MEGSDQGMPNDSIGQGMTVQDGILDDAGRITAQMVAEYVDVLANFRSRMTPRDADRLLGIKANTIRGACERHEIEYTRSGKGYRVTPRALAAYVKDYLTTYPDPLPG